ncbi:MAG: VWA domain-containing protein, partial [Kangiellaceae bacterium]|nr:VWA domain-containing protein [Kangiellaceae bacterium]
GEYEIRYASGDGYKTLASTTINLTAATASMKILGLVYTNRPFKVEWQGPNNERDYITIVKVGAKEKSWLSYTYTRWGNPLSIKAPKEAGDYELRYATGSSYTTLARIPVKVLASKTPGTLYVSQAINTSSSSEQTSSSKNAVEIILDASGSMLKKQNGQRRIDIAKQALESLIEQTLSDKDSVAIRAFGHIKADSCDGEVVLPLATLDKQLALKTINGVTPKNLAKTPIAASLAMVEKDLANVSGMRKVILVTDGEETCDGDPEQVIESLKEKGINVQINIVGFAIDDFGLKQTFQKWAELGNGRYFDANDKKELAKTIQEATKRTYQVLASDNKIIASGTVNGSPIDLLPGTYQIKLDDRIKTVEITSDEQSSISF